MESRNLLHFQEESEVAARFRLVARGRGGEEHCAETGEGGPGRDHGRVRPPRLHGMIERTWKRRHLVNGIVAGLG